MSLGIETWHEANVGGGSIEREGSLIQGYYFTPYWFGGIKMGYGHRDVKIGDHQWMDDIRISIGVRFYPQNSRLVSL